MRYLIDTHVFLWWLDGDKKLVAKSRDLIANEGHTIMVSAASAWEIATKYRIGKLPGAAQVAMDVSHCIRTQEFEALAVSVDHAQQAGALPGPHRDPFDRMLIAQCQLERIPLISIDDIFDAYGITRIWK